MIELSKLAIAARKFADTDGMDWQSIAEYLSVASPKTILELLNENRNLRESLALAELTDEDLTDPDTMLAELIAEQANNWKLKSYGITYNFHGLEEMKKWVSHKADTSDMLVQKGDQTQWLPFEEGIKAWEDPPRQVIRGRRTFKSTPKQWPEWIDSSIALPGPLEEVLVESGAFRLVAQICKIRKHRDLIDPPYWINTDNDKPFQIRDTRWVSIPPHRLDEKEPK